MDCDEFNDPHDVHGEVPSRLLCSEASSVSDKVVTLLGDALEEHRIAVAQKLGLSSEGPLSEALYDWCQLPGSTVFVLRAVLVDIGRKDLADRLVHEIMQTMSLYLVVEDVDPNTNNARRRFFTVTTNCDVTLAAALESFLQGNLSRYRIIGPEDRVTWSTSARELKGRQLTVRYVASKTDKAVYGCNSDTGDSSDVKGQAYKANFHEPVKGLSELKGLHTFGVENRPLHDESITCIKRAQTMPTFFNIPPGDHDSDMVHAIQDLKQPAISPAPPSESVTSNMAAMNTMTTPSPTESLSLAGQGGSSCHVMSLTLTSIEDQLSIDSTHVKVPMGKKTTRRLSVPEVNGNMLSNNDYVSTTELKTRKETNTDQRLTVTAGSADQEKVEHSPENSMFQRSLSNNNLQASYQRMEQNQLSGPVKQLQKDNNYLETKVNQQPSTAPGTNAHKKENFYINTQVKPMPTFENEDVGFKELNESMEISTDDCRIPERNQYAASNDFNMSSSLDLARRYNRDLDSDSTSNIYTPFSAMISPLSGHDGSHEVGSDSWHDDSSVVESTPESDANNVDVENHFCESTQKTCPVPFINASNGKFIALEEQDRKLRQVTSNSQFPSARYQILHGQAGQESADLKMNFSHTKPSPFVHTPPPPLYSSDTFPPSYLDVTSLPGREIFPWSEHNNIFHPEHYLPQCNCHVLQSHSHAIAHTTCPQHQRAPIMTPLPVPARSLPAHPTTGLVSYGRGRDIGVQTPPARRHFPPHHPMSDTISSVSEPTMRHPPAGRQLSHGGGERLGCQNGLYLTPLHDAGDRRCQQVNMAQGFASQTPRVAPLTRRPSSPGNDVDEDYSCILEDPRVFRQSGRRQSNLEVPNRAPPPPPRPKMNLEDQLAKINGWCPAATDTTIERIMKDYRGENGYYIVWKSQAKNRYIISVSHKRNLLHFLIEQVVVEHNPYRYLYYIYNGGFSSESLLELVNHYISCGVKQRLNDSPIGTKAYACEHIPLRRPLKMRKSFSVDS